MPLIMEFRVYGYPYPSVSLSHNEDIVLKGTKVDQVYMYIRQNAGELENGDYTFTAENSLENASIIIKVKVVGESLINKG